MTRFWLWLLCALVSFPVSAADGTSEKRMHEIATELRCLVCQNETIAASRADFAVDIRKLILEQIESGESDQAIQAFLVARYGDYILYRPPLKITTVLLWFGPALLLFAGLTVLALALRRRKRTIADTALSDEEKAAADALLNRTPYHGD